MITAVCISQASVAYAVPKVVIEYVIENHPSNGAGPMGIPSAWLPILDRAGFPTTEVVRSGCENVAAGTWILAYMKLSGADWPSASSHNEKLAPPSVDGAVSNACVREAASKNGLAITLLRGVLATEGGKVGQVHWNSNGTYDMGPAQVNSTWLPKLAGFGITREKLIGDGCLNVSVGAWILAQSMQGANPSDPVQFWQHVGDYNSATPYYNTKYASEVWKHVTEIAAAGE